LSEKRLLNAGKLTYLLQDEGKRWENEIVSMELQATYQIGDVFIAAASVSYLGPFTGKYRNELLS